ncbi:hypothetical protein GF391_03200 [Candidatus Uhrbacteria bacterium]|nr:hypothetical protein [Candidatus Uhrbacteria bacterium]
MSKARKAQVLVDFIVIFTLGCVSSANPTPVENLVDKFGQNFNPNDYGHIVASAYKIAGDRKADPSAKMYCAGQDADSVNTEELVVYLAHCGSRGRVLDFFEARKLPQSSAGHDTPAGATDRQEKEAEISDDRSIKIDGIVIDEDLFQIYALLGKDPELYLAFMNAVVTNRVWDLNDTDTFRHPITTLRSGWADCDDFTVEYYFWAHLHNLNPNLVIAVSSDEDVEIVNGVKTLDAHTFVTYTDPVTGKMNVLDNNNWVVLEADETAQTYLQGKWPDKDLLIRFNGPYTGKSD